MVPSKAVSRILLFAVSCLSADCVRSEGRIESFSPTGYAKGVRQATVRFSEAMVPLGEPEQSDPFDIDCEVPGNGRWIDERHWAYDFDYDVPGAVRCDFNLRDDVRTLAGAAVRAPPEYTFHTGGPDIVHHEPYVGEPIDERQVFLLALDAVAQPGSVREHVRCRIDTAETGHPVDLIQGAERTTILNALETAHLRRIYDLVDPASSHLPAGDEHETRSRALERVVMVRCRDPLPAGSDVELVWGPGIAGLNGRATTRERVLSFTVRPAFEAQLECASRFEERCVGGIHVHFTADVDREIAGRLRLVGEDGTVIPAEKSDWPVVDILRFPGAYRDLTSYRAEVVAPIADIDGRALANATGFPKTIRVGRLPPGASFGMGLRSVEPSDGTVAPVLLRRIDEPLAGRRRKVADDADIVAWLRRVETAQDGENAPWDAVASVQSVFEVEPGDAFTLSPGTPEASYELAGVSLPGPGFHVVELDLPAAGSLPRRYVAGVVVATDLAVHIHRAGESSLAWVTRLSDGQPVAGADIAISDACTGQVVARAATDNAGLAPVPHSLLRRDACADFRYLVTARKGGDLAVTTSGSRWDHRPSAPTLTVHSILDRALYQPGDTVSVKVVVRRPSSDGLVLPGERATQAKVMIEHYGTDETQEATVAIAEDGSALASFELPANAKLGDYGVEVDVDGYRNGSRSYFRVERFRIGAMRATIDGPDAPQLNTGSVPVTLSVQHLAGGAAASLPVEVRSTVRPWLYYWEDLPPPEPRTRSEILDSNGKARLELARRAGCVRRARRRAEGRRQHPRLAELRAQRRSVSARRSPPYARCAGWPIATARGTGYAEARRPGLPAR